MTDRLQELARSKTIWTAIVAIIAAFAGYQTGEMSAEVAIQTGLTALLAAFLRDGIAKNHEVEIENRLELEKIKALGQRTHNVVIQDAKSTSDELIGQIGDRG